jgi:CRISPR/Cas system CSM-associated protein Csm3 (group 7 of RAMP superfamily)
MTLTYTIKFLDYWHVGSGLSAGTKLDNAVLKEKNNLPFIGGKTLKGLAREMAVLLEDESFVTRCFGEEGVRMNTCYFSDAKLEKKVQNEIVDNQLTERLYDELSSTKVDEEGMAVDGSLRETEVVIPLDLQAEIIDIDSKDKEKMIQVLKMIKRIGLNRTRGLGRCEIRVEDAS